MLEGMIQPFLVWKWSEGQNLTKILNFILTNA